MHALERIAFDLDGQDLRIQLRVEASCQIAAILTAPRGRESMLRFDVESTDESGFTHVARIDLRRVVEDRRRTDHRVAIFVETNAEDGETTVSPLGRSAVTDRPQRTLRTVVDGVGVRVDVGPGGNVLLAVGEDLAPASLTAVPLAFRPRGSQLDVKVRTMGDASVA